MHRKKYDNHSRGYKPPDLDLPRHFQKIKTISWNNILKPNLFSRACPHGFFYIIKETVHNTFAVPFQCTLPDNICCVNFFSCPIWTVDRAVKFFVEQVDKRQQSYPFFFSCLACFIKHIAFLARHVFLRLTCAHTVKKKGLTKVWMECPIEDGLPHTNKYC